MSKWLRNKKEEKDPIKSEAATFVCDLIQRRFFPFSSFFFFLIHSSMHVGFVLARVSALSNKSNSFFCFVLWFYFGLYFLVVGCPKLLDLLHAQSCFGAIFFSFCFCVNSSQHTHTHTHNFCLVLCCLDFGLGYGPRSLWSFAYYLLRQSGRNTNQKRGTAPVGYF